MLHERLALLAPTLLEDLLVDLVAHLEPAAAIGREGPLVGEAQAPVDGDPAHELRVDEVAPSAANLPDPFVGFVPVIAHVIEQALQLAPQVIGDRSAVFVVEIDRIEQLAVDIQLGLLKRAVSDANRPRAPVSLEVIQGLLLELLSPIDGVDGLKGTVRLELLAPLFQPAHEALRFAIKTQAHQAIKSKAGIANPAKAVVPVAHPADLFRQARGRRRDDGPGRRVREQFQDQGRAINHFAPSTGVFALGKPALPEIHRVPKGLLSRFLRNQKVGLAPALGLAEEKGRRFAPVEREIAHDSAPLNRKRNRRGQPQRPGRAHKQNSLGKGADFVGAARIVEGRKTLEAKSNVAGDGTHAPNNLVIVGMVTPQTARLDGHEVDYLADPFITENTRDQDIGIGEIELLARSGSRGGDFEIAPFLIVEQRAEHARRIEMRKTTPIDRAVHADQCDRVEVSDHPVVFNRFVRHSPSFSRRY